MELFDIQLFDQRIYVMSYTVVEKRACETYNYISPTFRLLRFIDGEVEWKIGENYYLFRKGDIVFFNNLHKRNINNVLTDSIKYELYDFLPNCIENESLRSFFYSKTQKLITCDSKNSKKTHFLLDCLKNELYQPNDNIQKMSIRHYIDLIALQFYRNAEEDFTVADNSLIAITSTVQYIQNHLSERMSISELAKKSGYSPEYFSRLFKRYIGLSPIEYINNLRIENTLRLMSTTELTVLDAAYQSGFQSSSNFYKIFKAYKKTTPTEYQF